MTNEEIAAVLRPERNRLRREMEKYASESLQSDPTGPYRVGIIEGMNKAIHLLTKRIHELEEIAKEDQVP